MEKVLVSIPDPLAARMRATIPPRQRSKIIASLLEAEILRREQALYECALAVQKDEDLSKELEDWDTTLLDGLDNE